MDVAFLGDLMPFHAFPIFTKRSPYIRLEALVCFNICLVLPPTRTWAGVSRTHNAGPTTTGFIDIASPSPHSASSEDRFQHVDD